MWNPWHGCHKISEGCRYCYVYREDAAFGAAVPSSEVRKTASFNLPARRDRRKNWKYPSGTEFALCFTSDLLIEEADGWRDEIWEMIRLRSDCRFFFFTKRIERLSAARRGRRLRQCRHRLHCREPAPRRPADADIPVIAHKAPFGHSRSNARASRPVKLSRP